MNYQEIIKELDRYGLKATEEARQIIQSNAYASGNLFKSLEIKLTESGDSIGLVIEAPAYAKFIDQGVQGSRDNKKAPKSPFKFKNKMPPSAPINRWVLQKGLAPRDSKGRFTTRKSLVFLIRRSIFEKGIKAVNFTEPFYSNLDNLFLSLEKKFGEEVANQIRSVI